MQSNSDVTTPTPTFYVIRDDRTGYCLPNPLGWKRRGYTWREMADPSKIPPLMLADKAELEIMLKQWLKGKFHVDHDNHVIIKCSDRDPQHVHIEEVVLTLRPLGSDHCFCRTERYGLQSS